MFGTQAEPPDNLFDLTPFEILKCRNLLGMLDLIFTVGIFN